MPSAHRAVSPGEVLRAGLCIGCGSCAVGQSGNDVSMGWDRYGQLLPTGPAGWRETRSTEFAAICPFSPAATNEDEIAAERFPAAPQTDGRIGRYSGCYVGATREAPFRVTGSSGGMVSWVAAELLRRGEVDGVLHVHPGNPGEPFFGYRISRDVDELLAGAKSRYHPIHLADVLGEVRAAPGRYAVVGIPCFIKAVHLACARDPVLSERISVTLGLFCGHMKSTRFVTSFAWQLGVDPAQVRAVEYRLKDEGRPANWYRAQLTLDDGSTLARDWSHLAGGDWGAGYFQNAACNWCDDVVAETADVSFGDAWVEPYASDGRGTNVVVVRSALIQRLIDAGRAEGRLELDAVDADFIAETQAAGFRQRREGLAYRLTWRQRGLRPVKRVQPGAHGLPWQRKLVYRTRAGISAWSHRVALLAMHRGKPRIYIRWAWAVYRLYEGMTYGRGRFAPAFAWAGRRLSPRRRPTQED